MKPPEPAKLYKVVERSIEGSLCSSSVHKVGICVCYTPGEWARPVLEGTKLFCFVSEYDAEDFIRVNGYDHHEIWEAEGKDTGIQYRRLFNPDSIDKIILFWENPLNNNIPFMDCYGIVTCSEVKLIKKVYPYESLENSEKNT